MEIKDIYHKYWRPLNYYAQGIVKSKEDAEDIVSSVFENAVKHPGRFENLVNLEDYLYVSVRNRCFNFRRRNGHMSEFSDRICELFFSDEDPYGDLYEVKMEVLRGLIKQLNPDQQKLFNALYIEGLKTSEIADICHIQKDSLRSNKRYMLNTLRKLILPYKKLIYK